MTATALQVVSNREMARRLGVTEKAIRRGILHGRFCGSLGKDDKGRVVIVDPELASQEWLENAGRRRALSADIDVSAREDAPDTGVFIPATTLADAQRLNANERARKLRMENDLREGNLLEVQKQARLDYEAYRILRESVLNVPARFAAEMAAETDASRLQIRLDAVLREALTRAAEVFAARADEELPVAHG